MSKITGVMSHGKLVPTWSTSDNNIVSREIKKNTPVEKIAKMLSEKRSDMAVNVHARELGFKKIPTYASLKRDAEKTKARGKMVTVIAGAPEKRGVGRPRKVVPSMPVQKGNVEVETLLKHILNEQRVGNEINNKMLSVWKGIATQISGSKTKSI